jgi:hypothetical protein
MEADQREKIAIRIGTAMIRPTGTGPYMMPIIGFHDHFHAGFSGSGWDCGAGAFTISSSGGDDDLT